jgi:type VI secretion system secreted protein VgrG
MARTFKLDSPLGDRLLFARLSGSEGLGELFQYQLTALSERADVRPAELLGQRLTVSMDLGEGRERHFSGHVTAMHRSVDAERGRTRYELTLRPWLWFLTRTSDCRIFQDMTVPEILAAVFEDEASQRVELRLSGAYRSWSYCVQYRETDFNFVSRLMEQEGIYYYFEHSADGHVMVLCDAPGAHVPIEGGESVRYVRTADARVDEDAITGVEDRVQVEPGRYAMTEYDFRSPGSSLAVMRQPALPIEHAKADYEVFDYPGEYDAAAEGDDYAGVRIEEARARAEVFEFTGTERDAATGRRFKLGGHPRRGFNLEYLIVATQFSAEESHYGSTDDAGTSWSMSFTAIRNQQSWRPLRATPKPVIQGVQTAVVTGPAGEEIHTDKFGRIRVQFHWDRYGRRDEKSSCWVRVAYPIAGKGWGMVAVPRIGHEVVVSFEEGDPDRPLVIGSVYNGDNPAPWPLPADATQSGLLSRSSKGGGAAHANAIRFEDKKGAEELWTHAERDQRSEVERNERHSVGANRTKSVGANESNSIGADQSTTVGKNRSIVVGMAAAETVALAKALTIGAAYQVTVGAAMNETVGGIRATQVGGHFYESAGGEMKIDVGETLTVHAVDGIKLVTGDSSLTMLKDGSIELKGRSITIQTGAGTLEIMDDGKITVSGTDTTLQAAAGKVAIDPGGIVSVKGPMVKINT